MGRRSVALAALSGLLLAASFPTIDLGPLAWVGLVPLFLALRRSTLKEAFWLGGIAGLVYFCGTIYWVTNSVNFYGHVPLVLASLITLLLCAYCALYPALFAAASVRLRLRPALFFLAAPALWTALEFARTYVFSGFPWALLGYTQYRALPVIQFADITSVYGVSFLIVLANVSLAELIGPGRRWLPLAVTAAAVAAALAYGQHRLHEPQGAGSIRIAVVQGNIEQDRKWDPAYQSDVIGTYYRLTGEALKDRPDLVIWPETATPFYFGGEGDFAFRTDQLRQFVRSIRTPLLTGTPTYEKRDGRYLLRNSAVFLDAKGGTVAMYTKHHLVPFGEYVPLKSSILFFVDKLVQAIGDFQPGTAYTVVQEPSASLDRDVPLSTVICYEIIFPDLVRKFVNDGATVMTNITNDAWFGKSGAPYQHFAMAVFRAVENHVPIARAANTGISGFIDSNGNILARSSIFTEAVLVHDLVPGKRKTFYTRHGDVFAWLCTLFTLLLLALPLRSAAQKRNPA